MANNLFNQLNQSSQNSRRETDVNSIMQEVRQSGMSARDLFFKKVRERGIDPNSILSQIPMNFK